VADTGNDRFERWGWIRPDATIAIGLDGQAVGDDVYNTTGRHQEVRARLRPGGSVDYRVVIAADGAYWAPLLLRGGAATPQFDISYWARHRNITQQVVVGTFRTPIVSPSHPFRVRITVTPRPGAAAGDVADRVLRASATVAPGADAVRFVTTFAG
jgi:hypothetical protein